MPPAPWPPLAARASVRTHWHVRLAAPACQRVHAPACTHWCTRMHTLAHPCVHAPHLRRPPARIAQHVSKHPCLACPRPPWLYAMLPPGSPRAAFASPLTSRHAPTQLPMCSVCIARPPVHARAEHAPPVHTLRAVFVSASVSMPPLPSDPTRPAFVLPARARRLCPHPAFRAA